MTKYSDGYDVWALDKVSTNDGTITQRAKNYIITHMQY